MCIANHSFFPFPNNIIRELHIFVHIVRSNNRYLPVFHPVTDRCIAILNNLRCVLHSLQPTDPNLFLRHVTILFFGKLSLDLFQIIFKVFFKPRIGFIHCQLTRQVFICKSSLCQRIAKNICKQRFLAYTLFNQLFYLHYIPPFIFSVSLVS